MSCSSANGVRKNSNNATASNRSRFRGARRHPPPVVDDFHKAVRHAVDVLLGVLAPQREPESPPALHWCPRPMACNTCEGPAAADEHAEPAETAMPRVSNAKRSVSPATCSKLMFRMCGSLLSGWPFNRVCGIRSWMLRSSLSRRPARRAAAAGDSWVASSMAFANPTINGMFSVPGRFRRSWPPPCSNGSIRVRRRT